MKRQINIDLGTLRKDDLQRSEALINTLHEGFGELANDFRKAIGKIENIKINAPDVPDIHIPEPKDNTKEIVEAIKSIKITVPETKLPKIVVPKPEVNVSSPKVVVRPNIIVNPVIPSNPAPRIVEEKELYSDGQYDGYEEKFDNGSTHSVTGYSRGRVKHKWA